MKARLWCVAAIAATSILGLAAGATASNSFAWDDPAGDSANAADLTQIAVRNDDTGNITFALTFGNRPGLGSDDAIEIWLDTDDNESTGNHGFDYVIYMVSGNGLLKHATSTGLEDTLHSTFSASADGRTASVNRSELGSTSRFDFFVRSSTLSEADTSIDEAPDASNEVFVYSLTAAGPDKILVLFAPKTPKAGATFSAVVPLVQLDDGSTAIPEKLGCKGTLNRKPLAGAATLARCVWKLPKSAKGKRLSITIVVTVNGAKATFGPWRFKVR